MLRDITIGQHFPGNSVVHRCDPRFKLLATIGYIVVLYSCGNAVGVALSVVLLGVLYALAKIPFRLILKSLKPIVPIIIFTSVINLFFITGEGEPLVSLWIFKIYPEGVSFRDRSVLSFAPSLCASVQAALAVKMLIGRPVETGTLYYFDLLNLEFETIKLDLGKKE